MTAPTLLEAEQIARTAGHRARAASELALSSRGVNPFAVIANVLSGAGAFGFAAVSTSLPTRGLVGAAAGGALALAAVAYGEVRRLRRRVDALEVLANDGGM